MIRAAIHRVWMNGNTLHFIRCWKGTYRRCEIPFYGEKLYNSISRTIHNDTPLHLAVLEGHMQVLSFFIDELKCPPDIIGQCEMTPYVLLVGINNSDESVVCIIYTCFYQYLPMNQVSAIQLGNCNHCVGVVARCALLRHAFTAQITTTCSQSKQVVFPPCGMLLW